MTHLIGNNDVKLAKMRIVYKNTQTLLNQLSQTTSYTDEQRSHYEQLVEIYESVHPSK